MSGVSRILPEPSPDCARRRYQIARDFNCGTDAVEVIGQSGRAVELTTGR
jgi:hypothetical protein